MSDTKDPPVIRVEADAANAVRSYTAMMLRLCSSISVLPTKCHMFCKSTSLDPFSSNYMPKLIDKLLSKMFGCSMSNNDYRAAFATSCVKNNIPRPVTRGLMRTSVAMLKQVYEPLVGNDININTHMQTLHILAAPTHALPLPEGPHSPIVELID